LNKKKREKYLWNKYFGIDNPEGLPIYVRHANFRTSEIDDEGIELMVKRITGIEILDLDETNITGESVKLLTKLQGVKELRLKGNAAIGNDSVDYLSQMTSLELLHLGGTSITVDAVSKLASLQNLKLLLLSAADNENVQEKLFELAVALPDCRFIVNYKDVNF
jgi:Leucine-rich repeat (LRR) protein